MPRREALEFFYLDVSWKSIARTANATEISERRLVRAPVHIAVRLQITQAVVTRKKFSIDIQDILVF